MKLLCLQFDPVEKLWFVSTITQNTWCLQNRIDDTDQDQKCCCETWLFSTRHFYLHLFVKTSKDLSFSDVGPKKVYFFYVAELGFLCRASRTFCVDNPWIEKDESK